MEPSISPQHLHKIQKLLSVVGGYSDFTHSADAKTRELLDETKDSIKSIVDYAWSKDHRRYGEVYADFNVGTAGVDRIITHYNTVIKDALNLYINDIEEEIYLSLLETPVQQLNGYKYSILIKKILRQNSHLLRGK